MLIKYIALAGILLCGGYFLKEYLTRVEAKAREYRAVYSFILFAKERLASFLLPLPELCRGFAAQCGVTEACSFTDALAEGNLSSAADALTLMEDADLKEVRLLFERLGQGFKEEETERLCASLCYFEERLSAVLEEEKKTKQLAPALFAAAFAALLIFVL